MGHVAPRENNSQINKHIDYIIKLCKEKKKLIIFFFNWSNGSAGEHIVKFCECFFAIS